MVLQIKYNYRSKSCVRCYKIFVPLSGSQKRCFDCRILICSYCKKEFSRPSDLTKNYKYCSQTCYLNSRWEHTGKCLVCGNKTLIGKFCSDCVTNREVYKIRDKKRWIKRKREWWDKKLEIIKILGGKCSECGNNDYRVLQLNHIDRSKKIIPKKRQYTNHNRMKDWIANLDNMNLLCANCHTIHTWEQMNYYIMDK